MTSNRFARVKSWSSLKEYTERMEGRFACSVPQRSVSPILTSEFDIIVLNTNTYFYNGNMPQYAM